VSNLFPALSLLDSRSARAFAKYFAELASTFETRAEELEREERAAESREKRIRECQQIWAKVEDVRQKKQCALEEALQVVQKDHGSTLPIESIRNWYEAGAKHSGRMQHQMRLHEIARLYRLGYSNQEIAKRVGLSKNYVANLLVRIRVEIASPGWRYSDFATTAPGALSDDRER
jgi:DNA-binding CsgD family transcriptional regulator